MKLFGRDIELNKKHPISFSEEDVELGYDDYREAIQATSFNPEEASILRKLDFKGSEAQLNKWIVTGKGVYVGSWTKRLQKYVAKEYNVKLSPESLAELGEKLSRISVSLKGSEFLLELTNHSNWTPGTFGESKTSCWWGSYTPARNGLTGTGGGGVLLYSPTEVPRARCWYYPIDFGDNAVIFNVYDTQGKLTLLSFARLLSMAYGVTYKRTYNVSIPNAYINGNDTFVVGLKPPDRRVSLLFAIPDSDITTKGFTMLGTRPILSVGVMDDTRGFGAICRSCGIRIADNQVPVGLRTRTRGVMYFHRAHFPDMHCHNCGDTVDRTNSGNVYHEGRVHCHRCVVDICTACGRPFFEDDQIETVNGESICSTCYDDYSSCDRCGDMHHNDDLTYCESTGDDLCENCLTQHMFFCDRCENWERIEDEVEVEGDHACSDCFNDHGYTCDRCNNKYWNDSEEETVETTRGDELWCRTCNTHHSEYCETCEVLYSDTDHNHEEEEADDENAD